MRCPECGSTRIATDARGETACQVCGLVLAQTPLLATEPTRPAQTAVGLRLTGRLAKTQRRAQEKSASERRFIDAAQQTRRAGSDIQCPPDVSEEAARILRRAQKEGVTQGRDLRAMGAAALLASCRRLHLARSEDDVARAAGVDVGDLRRSYKALTRALGLKVPAITAHEHMARIASRVKAPPRVEAEARRILAPVCGTRSAAGRNPLGWAAAALALAAQHQGVELSVNRVAKAASVSNSTVALRMRDLEALATQEGA